MLEHFGKDACGEDSNLKPLKAAEGIHHNRRDSLRLLSIHSAPWPGLRSVPLMFVLQSGNKIRLHFVVEADLGEILGDPDLWVRQRMSCVAACC